MSKNQLKAILKINGFTDHSSDEDIRKVLLNAGYTEQDVSEALLILKNDLPTNIYQTQGLHKVFYTDKTLRASEVAALLGIEIQITDPVSSLSKEGTISIIGVLAIFLIGFLLATVTIFAYMFVADVGIFHPGTVSS